MAVTSRPTRPAPILQNRAGFRRRMVNWFRKHARDLPWRGTRDPYRVWVSEIILQQTRVDQGTPYIERFLKRFPTVEALARAEIDQVLKLWEGLGYYSRARNLHRAAVVVTAHGAGLPHCAADWMELPGVGRYTAGAIASIAFDEPVPVLDGNVKRVLARLLDLETSIDESPTVDMLWKVSEDLVRGRAPGDFNQAMMELGAAVCMPRSPDCGACPVSSYCLSKANGTQNSRPVRRAKKQVPHKEIVVAAIRKNGRYLLGKRPMEGLLGGLWEFPGGKVEPGEDHESALLRELREELGIEVEVGELIACVNHAYSHFKVTLNVYACRHVSGTPRPNAHTELKWVPRKRFSDFTFPKANHKFLSRL